MIGMIVGGVLLFVGAAAGVVVFALTLGNWILQGNRIFTKGKGFLAGFAGHLLGMALMGFCGLVSLAGLIVLVVSAIGFFGAAGAVSAVALMI